MVELGVTRPFQDRVLKRPPGSLTAGLHITVSPYKTAGSLRTPGEARNQPAVLNVPI